MRYGTPPRRIAAPAERPDEFDIEQLAEPTDNDEYTSESYAREMSAEHIGRRIPGNY